MVLASVFVASGSYAGAGAVSSPALGEQADSSLNALERASQYSVDTCGVGILIGYGHGNGDGVTAIVIGEQFVNELKRRGIPSKYFFYNADWDGMSVEYHIGYSALGPWGVDEAAMNIGQAAERVKAVQKVHRQK